MRELDTMAVHAKSDQHILEELIQQNEFFILKCASKSTHRYITKSDDEWSIALMAFTQALESYKLEKGSFLSFAELIIHRRLIDYNRNQGKYYSEISVDPVIFDTEPEEEDDNMAMRMAVADKVAKEEKKDLKYEIEAITSILVDYGFSFYDLTSCSPRATKTKISCSKAVNFMLDNPLLVNELRDKKLLPLKVIEVNAKVPRKILERHRKYIIAATEILSGEYPYLADYLRYIREES